MPFKRCTPKLKSRYLSTSTERAENNCSAQIVLIIYSERVVEHLHMQVDKVFLKVFRDQFIDFHCPFSLINLHTLYFLTLWSECVFSSVYYILCFIPDSFFTNSSHIQNDRAILNHAFFSFLSKSTFLLSLSSINWQLKWLKHITTGRKKPQNKKKTSYVCETIDFLNPQIFAFKQI